MGFQGSTKPSLLQWRLTDIPWRRVGDMFGFALLDFVRNNCPYLSAGIAFWALFSIFPLSLATISVLGFLNSSPESQRMIVERLVDVVPVSSEYMQNLVQDVIRTRGTLGILAAVALIFSSTTVFSAIRKGINHAWHIGKPPFFILERSQDFAMLLGAVVIAGAEVGLSTNLLGFLSWINTIGGPVLELASLVIAQVFLLLVTFWVLALLYRYLPNTEVAWQDVWLGAGISAVLIHVIRLGFTWFVSSFDNFNLVYGSLGALMAVLMWAYLSAMVIVWGAEVSYVYRRTFGLHAEPDFLTDQPADNEGEHGRKRGITSTVIGWAIPSAGTRRFKILRPLEVAAGVYQIWGVGSKTTVIVGEDEVVMIDAGGPGSLRFIEKGLSELNMTVDQIDLIVLTHYHPDHTGGLEKLVRASSAKVAAHHLEADMLARKTPFPSPFQNRALAKLTNPVLSRLYGKPVKVDYLLDHDDRLPVSQEIRVVHTPGHTQGSICLYLEAKKMLIVGDALQYRFRKLSLPAASVTLDMELAVESVKRLLDLDFDTICFSHFPPLNHDAHSTLKKLVESVRP